MKKKEGEAEMRFPFHTVYQQAGNWYVLDEDFPWNLQQLKLDVSSLIGLQATTVFFCDTCDVNSVLTYFGEEQEEFLLPINGFYHRERKFVFVCVWEEYEQVLETLLHELRHDMQYKNEQTKRLFYNDNRVYENRWIETDARTFAKMKMKQYREQQ